jgi:hypothetical protein
MAADVCCQRARQGSIGCRLRIIVEMEVVELGGRGLGVRLRKKSAPGLAAWRTKGFPVKGLGVAVPALAGVGTRPGRGTTVAWKWTKF